MHIIICGAHACRQQVNKYLALGKALQVALSICTPGALLSYIKI